MKITFTLDEAKQLLASHSQLASFGLGTIDLTIETNVPAGANYVESICRVRKEFPACNHPGVNSTKIPAIKRLRELTGIGLAEAKHAVERPDEAIGTWIRHGKYLTCY